MDKKKQVNVHHNTKEKKIVVSLKNAVKVVEAEINQNDWCFSWGFLRGFLRPVLTKIKQA